MASLTPLNLKRDSATASASVSESESPSLTLPKLLAIALCGGIVLFTSLGLLMAWFVFCEGIYHPGCVFADASYEEAPPYDGVVGGPGGDEWEWEWDVESVLVDVAADCAAAAVAVV
ncbi:hypothetical protein E4U34_005190 [Claviceps purpurea]|nr:hypothetical protein E4U34_005190 [Claviceps purpurea]